MRRSVGALVALMLAVSFGLTGCGGGGSSTLRSSPPPEINTVTAPAPGQTSSSPGTTSAAHAGGSTPAPSATIVVKIPGLLNEHNIPARYTCDGADVSPPVHWSHIPTGTVELVMFVANLRPSEHKTFFDWAVAGLSPASYGVPSGKLPPGAVVGRNSFGRVGYSICPAKGIGEEDFALRLVALRRRLGAKSGFSVEALYREAERYAGAVGLSGGIYTRQ